VAPQGADRALDILRAFPVSCGAVCVGQVLEGPEGLVTMKTQLGTERVIDMLSGEQLPRIC
jgi:hydrogenase expression/formation protein HypE